MPVSLGLFLCVPLMTSAIVVIVFPVISIALSLFAQGSYLSNQPNLPVTPQDQRRCGDKKGEYGRQLNHGQCFGSDCWGS